MSDSNDDDIIVSRCVAHPIVISNAVAMNFADDSEEDIIIETEVPNLHQNVKVDGEVGGAIAVADSDTDDDDLVFHRGPRSTIAAAVVYRMSPSHTNVSESDDEDMSLGALSAQFSRAALAPTKTPAPAPASAPAPAPALAQAAAVSQTDPWSLCSEHARLPGGFNVRRELFDKLFPYQREGIAWMWSLHADAPVAAGSLGRATERATSGCVAVANFDGGASGANVRTQFAIAPSLAAVAHGDAKISGGILADDMGLGKTVQTVTFLAGLLAARKTKGDAHCAALIVLPVSLLETWRAEFARFAPSVRVATLHEQAGAAARAVVVRRAAAGCGVLLTTYGLVSSTPSLFGAEPTCGDAASEELAAAVGAIKWAALVLDEGHRVKNPATAAARGVRALPAHFRLLLTGTPIQNNLDELWALYDCVAHGRLLDTRPVFNRSLGNRISAARDRRSTVQERADGAEATAALMALVSPYFLRREKDKLLALTTTTAESTAEPGTNAVLTETAPLSSLEKLAPSAVTATGAREGTAMGTMGAKKEVVIWTMLAPAQATLYKAYLAMSAEVRAALGGGDEAAEVGRNGRAVTGTGDFVLSAIMNLRKLATHPILLTRAKLAATFANAAAANAGSDEDDTLNAPAVAWIGERARAHAAAVAESAYDSNGEERLPGAAAAAPPPEPAWSAGNLPSAEALVAASGKLQALVLLLRRAAIDGRKSLIFSQHTRTLDIVEKVLARLFSLDGRVAGVAGLDGPGDVPAAAFARGGGGKKLLWKRVDGTLKPDERIAAVRAFNTDPAVAFCLLSTGVGALGLTLTAATRVVLLDISWNPATDQQAVDRAYRVGQVRDVVTYRLITAGTVEEKMYRLQMFKSGLSTSVMGARGAAADAAPEAASAMRFLSKSDIKNLFELGSTTYSETQRLVDGVIEPPPVLSREIREHLLVLAAPPHAQVAVGLSHHDGLFSLHPETVAAIQEQLAEARTAAREAIQEQLAEARGKPEVFRRKRNVALVAEDTDDDDDDEVKIILDENENSLATRGGGGKGTVAALVALPDDETGDEAAELAELAELRALQELDMQ